IANRLALLRQEGAVDEAKRRSEVFTDIWRRDLPFVSRTGMLVLGPPYDAAACAGEGRSGAECFETWGAWASAFNDRARSTTP
ncbi:MAG: hypothetical protein ABW133_10255, partial [Polyangiaceae bacterium]